MQLLVKLIYFQLITEILILRKNYELLNLRTSTI